jgi:hypothetical protein
MRASVRFLSFLCLLSFGLVLPAGAAIPAAAAERPTPVIELRETFGRSLGEHTFLAMEAMRSVVQDTQDPAPLVAALEDNSAKLEAAFGGIYGQPAGAEFGRLWRQHIDALVGYATARQAADDQTAEAMLTTLATYRRDFSAFLARTDPNLGGEHEALALQLHIDQLVAFADADYERAFQAERVAYGHMFELGDVFALAISDRFPRRFLGARVAFSPSGELRMDLGRLLGEHLVLAAQAMRAGIDRSPDTAAAADALAENTQELSAVVARVYGQAAGEAFADAWAPHVDQYLVYVGEIAAGDTAGREAALSALGTYANRIANFLADANPKFSRVALREMIGHHVERLVEIVDRYSAGDWTGSVSAVRSAHDHMFQVSAALTRGITAQFPGRYQDLDVLPRTDVSTPGGTSPVSWPPLVLLVGGLLGLASLLVRMASPTSHTRTDDGRRR